VALAPGGRRGNVTEAEAYDAALREAFQAAKVVPLAPAEEADAVAPSVDDLRVAAAPPPSAGAALPAPPVTALPVPPVGVASLSPAASPTPASIVATGTPASAVVVEPAPAVSARIDDEAPATPGTPIRDEPVATDEVRHPPPAAALPALRPTVGQPPTASRRARQREAGTTAPDHLLEAPESLSAAADDFFSGLIRRTNAGR
jgi:hypothetical protein